MLTGYPIMSRPFYVFPACKCVYLQDALIAEVKKFVPSRKCQYIEKLEQQIMDGLAATAPKEEMARLEKLLDDQVAVECPRCDDMMIRTIDQPFIDRASHAAAIQSWRVPEPAPIADALGAFPGGGPGGGADAAGLTLGATAALGNTSSGLR